MRSITVRVTNPEGLHMRPAMLVAKASQSFLSSIEVHNAGTRANGASIIELFLLAATAGTDLEITAEGTDENAAIDAVARLFTDGEGI